MREHRSAVQSEQGGRAERAGPRGAGRRRRAQGALVAAVLVLVGIGFQGGAPVAAAAVTQPTLVRATPTATTPHVTNGNVRTVAEVGSTVVLGGDFTRSTDPNGTAVNRSYLLAFDKATGQIRRDWIPRLDGEVFSVVAAADGRSVYVGGRFNTVNGVATAKVARIDIATGARMTFQSGFDGVVTTMALQGNRLFVGGVFTKAQGRTRRVVALNASTGVIDDTMAVVFGGKHNGGDGKIWRIEPSPDGQHVVVVGSFTSVGGQARNQIAKLDTGAKVALSSWSTTAFAGGCSGFTDYVRDVSYSPDSSYFVVATTGAKGTGVNGTCDSVSRWADSTQAGATNTWIEYSGGDSYYSVEVTGSAVYVGGHMRWSNNSAGADSLGAGGVATTGIASLDPMNGLPLSWNPGRDRGRAVWQMLATPSGLWVANDTDRIAGGLYRGRIAFFPLAGGKAVPQPARLTLPATIDQLVPAAGATPARTVGRSFNGTTVGAVQTGVANASALAGTGAAFYADGILYTAHSDGTLRARTATGTTLGSATTVNLQRLTAFAADLKIMRGALYDQGRLYYTIAGSSTLFMRYFSVENKVVGAQRFSVATSSGAVSYPNITGMFRSGNVVYFADLGTGALRKGTWRTAGGIDPATVTTVSPANAGGISWTTTELWARPGTTTAPPVPPTPGVNQPPVGRVTIECNLLECFFDASESTDAETEVEGVVWQFGDESVGRGSPFHAYARAGTYVVTASIYDTEGATTVVRRTITVSATATAAPTARMTSYCSVSSCTFNGTGSTAASGSIASYRWEFGDGTTGTGATPAHAYARAGTFTVRLTVTDSGGRTGTTTATVSIGTAATPTSFVGRTNRVGATAKSHAVAAPTTVKAGDQLLLFVSTNAAGTTWVATPAGWTRLLDGPSSVARNAVFSRVATAADAGQSVSVTLGSTAKADLVLAAYRGVRVAPGGAAIAAGTVTPTRTAVAGDWVLSYWADKSSATKGWTTPTGSVVRHNAVGSGSGRVAEALVDTGAGGSAGARGGLKATQGATSSSSVAMTILLRPA